MKNRLTEWLVEPYLNESPDLDIKVGDVILMGRFKNKKVKVKSITYNEKGDLLINGKPALKFRKYDKSKLLLPSKKKDKDSVSPDPDMKGVEDENPIKKEDFAAVAGALYGGDIPSPSRKMVKKMKKKGNTSVPYGSGYKKIDERAKQAVVRGKLHKNITGFNLTYKGRKYKEIDFEAKKIDNKTELVTLRILNPKKLFGSIIVPAIDLSIFIFFGS